MSVCIFPGFGAHVKGMGKTLFDDFKELIQIADDILGYSIKKLCLDDPDDLQETTQYGHPALYVVCILEYLKMADKMQPDYFAGHSLGESCALFAANAFDFATGLQIVVQRAKWMADIQNGKMAVVIGISEEETQKIIDDEQLDIFIANVNSPSQLVVSGWAQNVIDARSHFSKRDVIFIPFEGMGPFHTPYMQGVKNKLIKYLNPLRFNDFSRPVISNVTGRPYDLEEKELLFANQIDHCVRWYDTIVHLLECGQTEFVEIGPVKVVSAFVRQIKKAKGR